MFLAKLPKPPKPTKPLKPGETSEISETFNLAKFPKINILLKISFSKGEDYLVQLALKVFSVIPHANGFGQALVGYMVKGELA